MRTSTTIIFSGLVLALIFIYSDISGTSINYTAGNGFSGSKDKEHPGCIITGAGKAGLLPPLPVESTPKRSSSRSTFNSIEIAISFYPAGSRNISGASEITSSDLAGECLPELCSQNCSEYDIDNSNPVFAWVKEATKLYSPDSWYMLMQYDRLPSVSQSVLACGRLMEMPKPAETFGFLSGTNVFDVICTMSSNIHELSHGYSRKNMFRFAADNDILLEMRNEGRLIYLSPSESYLVTFPRDLLFPSRQLAGNIPRDRRTLRYNTYIRGNTSTQPHGILALLDELNAYFLGSRFRYDMLEPYKIAADTPAEGFFEWASDAQRTMGAFFEIDYFMQEYLLHMKSSYPENYALLKSNSSFSDAWWAVRTSFSKLVNDYFQTIEDEVSAFNDEGDFEFRFENNRLWVRRSGSARSASRTVISDAMEKLLPVLKSDRFREIERDFTIAFQRDIYHNYPDQAARSSN